MSTAYNIAVAAQSDAANPKQTRMVSANAGSGKTRVLVDRVSRILLQKVEPEHILCLTYTKAAATEMQDRLYEKLGAWSILDKAALETELNDLLGEEFHDIALARRLFAKALETPEGLKVQTIHAFCERVLSRFPIEAGILPGYEPIEDAEITALSQEVRKALLIQAMENPKGEVNQAIQTLSLKMADQTLDGLFTWMAYAGEGIANWEEAGGVAELETTLGVKASDTIETYVARFWGNTDEEILLAAIPVLEAGLKTDVKVAEYIRDSLKMGGTLGAAYTYASVFLTQAGSLRKAPVTKRTMEATQDWFSADGKEAARVLQFFDELKALQLYELTRAVFTLAAPYAELFAKAKRDRRVLDFNDQILLVKDLLNRKAVSDWVRYKLDGGIEHILLDEAQDTSPEQWAIINSLAENFIQDSPDRDPNKPRTLFAVGDEKQSIYGFQGAKPEQFLSEIQKRLIGEARQVRMTMSFRSSQTVLNVVDAFLEKQGGRRAMFDVENDPKGSDIENHAAFRKDEGFVELWPLSLRPETGEENAPWDTTPVNAVSEGDQREVLAQKLAERIRTWLDAGEAVFDRELKRHRAMQAGDILILVRTRGDSNNSLYDAIIRHLKLQNIPLAGADRIKLSDAMIVRDLLSLSRFVLLPRDDLSLAEVLKGPIFGLDDMQLLKLATGRGKQSLWQAVRERDAELARQLERFIFLSRNHSPYEFFSAVLDETDASGHSIKRRFYKRLGMESREALDVFLGRAMDHQQTGVPSLQYFVRGFNGDDAQVKRDMDAAKGQVRVMTVHGAKGLEAPVVILPDTTQVPTYKDTLVPFGEGYFLKSSKSDLPQVLEPFIEAGQARQDQEQLRLLYVALTRAESRLVICGHQIGSDKNPYKEGSWYDWMSRTFEGLDTQTFETSFGKGLSYGWRETAEVSTVVASESASVKLPEWVFQEPREEDTARQRLSPSRLLADREGYKEPTEPVEGLSPLQRGIIVHQLLEVLPNYKAEQRPEKAMAILGTYRDLSPNERDSLISEVFVVLDNPQFSVLWGEGTQAEVSLAGQIIGLPEQWDFSAKIDRLCVTESEVLIIDYKSNQSVPDNEDAVDDVYVGQMAAYQALARQQYPGKTVKCGLLWTAAPKLMWLSSQKLEHALTKIGMLPNYNEDTDLLRL